MGLSGRYTPVRTASPGAPSAPKDASGPALALGSLPGLLSVLVRALCTCVRDGVGIQMVFSVACDGASSRTFP
jgi:hypothetical protein